MTIVGYRRNTLALLEHAIDHAGFVLRADDFDFFAVLMRVSAFSFVDGDVVGPVAFDEVLRLVF